MSKVVIELNSAGVRELLKSDEIKSACAACALRVVSNAGSDYKLEPRNYPERSGYAVFPSNAAGYVDNMKNNTLLKALHM